MEGQYQTTDQGSLALEASLETWQEITRIVALQSFLFRNGEKKNLWGKNDTIDVHCRKLIKQETK